MTPLEIEVKFYVPDPEEMRKRIHDMGALYKDESSERNIRFEDSDCSLINKNALLRLRKTDGGTELTYKGEPPEQDPEFKIHQELEVLVNDFDTAAGILKAIGFHKEQVYEKYRQTWEMDDAILCLDKMPFGDFLEIEGRPDNIRQIAGELGFDWEKRILANYLAIFDRLKAVCSLSFNDVTFENFRDVKLNFGDFVSLFAAGGLK